MPFFSIILPTYNRAHFLPKAIESVLKQTFEDWELIIVDDGSTDNTKEVVAKYQDSRIRYIYQKNQERSAARNNGIDQAQGEYICFLDSDDYYLPERLQKLFEIIIKTVDNEKLFFTDLAIERDGILQNAKKQNEIKETRQYDKIITATIHCQQVCGARKIFHEYDFNPTIRIGEDLELWIRINEKYKLQYLPNQCTVVVVDHNTRSVNEQTANSGKEYLTTLKFVFSETHVGCMISHPLKKRLISNAFFTQFKYWFYQKNRIKCIWFLFRSILAYIRHEQTKYKVNLVLRMVYFQKFENINRIL